MNYLQTFREGVGLPLWFLALIETGHFLLGMVGTFYFAASIPDFLQIDDWSKQLRCLVYYLYNMGVAFAIVYGGLVLIKIIWMLTLFVTSINALFTVQPPVV